MTLLFLGHRRNETFNLQFVKAVVQLKFSGFIVQTELTINLNQVAYLNIQGDQVLRFIEHLQDRCSMDTTPSLSKMTPLLLTALHAHITGFMSSHRPKSTLIGPQNQLITHTKSGGLFGIATKKPTSKFAQVFCLTRSTDGRVVWFGCFMTVEHCRPHTSTKPVNYQSRSRFYTVLERNLKGVIKCLSGVPIYSIVFLHFFNSSNQVVHIYFFIGEQFLFCILFVSVMFFNHIFFLHKNFIRILQFLLTKMYPS